MDKDSGIQHKSDAVREDRGKIESGSLPNLKHDYAIFEWTKKGQDLSGRPAVTYDPAAGRHFYLCNGIKVFVD